MINRPQPIKYFESEPNLVSQIRNIYLNIKPTKKRSGPTPIATAEPVVRLIREFSRLNPLGTTRDNKEIYLCEFSDCPAILREIGRLREITFREIGEGTNLERDLDKFDEYYKHLVLWDTVEHKIVGAYRLGIYKDIARLKSSRSLYTETLFNFQPEMKRYLNQTIELGRSFIRKEYQGKNSLDYLWQGIGKLMASRQDLRYFMGPVTISADIPSDLTQQLIYHFDHFYADNNNLASAKKPFRLLESRRHQLESAHSGMNQKGSFQLIQKSFSEQNQKIPVLFKQYTSLFESNGVKVIDFSIDPDFGNCIDGLFIADINRLKPEKKARYVK